MSISPETSADILRLARESVAGGLRGDPIPPPPPASADPLLHEIRGAFVTVRRHGELRGCIGQIEGVHPLWETVTRMARSAAFEDPRFPPLAPTEFDQIDFEVSVLSVVKQIDDPAQVVVGRHGLIVEQGRRKGLLLPQVPVEHGWTQREFLEQTCVKAGLDPNAWRHATTKLFIFSAEVLSEE